MELRIEKIFVSSETTL